MWKRRPTTAATSGWLIAPGDTLASESSAGLLVRLIWVEGAGPRPDGRLQSRSAYIIVAYSRERRGHGR